jgi:CheY-like chemotaxis protein
VANDGREALAALAGESFDVALMDVQMPEMDGLAATAAIRQAERATGKHLAIIGLTAHAMKGDRERCLRGGMDGYLSKPIQSREPPSAWKRWRGPGTSRRPTRSWPGWSRRSSNSCRPCGAGLESNPG